VAEGLSSARRHGDHLFIGEDRARDALEGLVIREGRLRVGAGEAGKDLLPLVAHRDPRGSAESLEGLRETRSPDLVASWGRVPVGCLMDPTDVLYPE